MAIDPGLLVDRKKFRANCSDLVKRIRNSRTPAGCEIRLPGDRSRKSYEYAEQSGNMDVDTILLKQLNYI